MARTYQRPVQLLFSGFPDELVAAWCGVSLKTAQLYRIGARKPSRQALRLFTLHRDGRVLGDGWEGWQVRKEILIDPEGNRTTRAQLRGWYLILQFAADLARRSSDPADRQHYWELLRNAG